MIGGHADAQRDLEPAAGTIVVGSGEIGVDSHVR
jgi:hypothetical protein